MNPVTTHDDRRDRLDYALRLGDDAVVLGQRLSEWCSNAPFLEEDLALANTALDFIGRARLYYGYAAELAGDGRDEDDFAYLRDQREFRNLLLCELPRGDFAFSMARQFFIDVYNLLYLDRLSGSADERLAAIAAKALKESRYHLRRSRDWMLRLGDGTDESQRRLQRAVDELWGFTHELFEPDALEQRLAQAGIAVDASALRDDWRRQVLALLAEARMQAPDDDWAVKGGREGYHTEHLGHLLTEMQSLHRAYPGCKW